jgi:hypothetical protein
MSQGYTVSMLKPDNLPPSEARTQHYIPKFYLKGFTDQKGRLWVYEKFKALRQSRPKDEAHKPDYYAHTERGQRDETAEQILQRIESKAAPIVVKLANRHFKPTIEQMGHVYFFIAAMFARVPRWRDFLDSRLTQIVTESTRVQIAVLSVEALSMRKR